MDQIKRGTEWIIWGKNRKRKAELNILVVVPSSLDKKKWYVAVGHEGLADRPKCQDRAKPRASMIDGLRRITQRCCNACAVRNFACPYLIKQLKQHENHFPACKPGLFYCYFSSFFSFGLILYDIFLDPLSVLFKLSFSNETYDILLISFRYFSLFSYVFKSYTLRFYFTTKYHQEVCILTLNY